MTLKSLWQIWVNQALSKKLLMAISRQLIAMRSTVRLKNLRRRRKRWLSRCSSNSSCNLQCSLIKSGLDLSSSWNCRIQWKSQWKASRRLAMHPRWQQGEVSARARRAIESKAGCFQQEEAEDFSTCIDGENKSWSGLIWSSGISTSMVALMIAAMPPIKQVLKNTFFNRLLDIEIGSCTGNELLALNSSSKCWSRNDAFRCKTTAWLSTDKQMVWERDLLFLWCYDVILICLLLSLPLIPLTDNNYASLFNIYYSI